MYAERSASPLFAFQLKWKMWAYGQEQKKKTAKKYSPRICVN